MLPPRSLTACSSLPPEGALRLRPGKAGSAAPAWEDMAPTLVASRTALPPEGALRLRPGKASSAAPAWEDMAPTLFTACSSLPPEGALRLRPGKAGSAAPAWEDMAPTLFTACNALTPEGAECCGSEPAGAGLDGTKNDCVAQSCGLQGLRLRPGPSTGSGPAEPVPRPLLGNAGALQCGFQPLCLSLCVLRCLMQGSPDD
jgi:hypothetical protein